ncbi:MAG: hypothetical protein E7609_01085 [Ruminococcaceae bacterium]|nr:hypothetical protein [Oscillospiraceae bacterium]
MENRTKPGLSGNSLKIIAMLAMLIDHIGVYLFPRVLALRAVGRLAFPIFAYMIAEGCAHTKSRRRYLLTIAGLGILCQVVATVVTRTLYQNILLTFSFSIAIVYCADAWKRAQRHRTRLFASLALFHIAFVVILLPWLLENYGFAFDYGALGVFLPIGLYYLPKKGHRLIFLTVTLIAFTVLWGGWIRLFSFLAVPLLALYNGKRGKAKLKYLFYIFYPTHLVLLYLIAEFFIR